MRNKGLYRFLIIAVPVLIVLAIVATRRQLWIAAIRKRYGKTDPYVMEGGDENYRFDFDSVPLRELVGIYLAGPGGYYSYLTEQRTPQA